MGLDFTFCLFGCFTELDWLVTTQRIFEPNDKDEASPLIRVDQILQQQTFFEVKRRVETWLFGKVD
jgi:hypothetical protein